MTYDPRLTFPETRDPQATAVITGGLAAFNLEKFGRVDSQTLDILVHDDNSGDIVGGLLGHSSLGLFFLDLFYLPEAFAERRARQPDHSARRGRGTAPRLHRCVRVYRHVWSPGFYERYGYRRFGGSPARPSARLGFSCARRSTDLDAGNSP